MMKWYAQPFLLRSTVLVYWHSQKQILGKGKLDDLILLGNNSLKAAIFPSFAENKAENFCFFIKFLNEIIFTPNSFTI